MRILLYHSCAHANSHRARRLRAGRHAAGPRSAATVCPNGGRCQACAMACGACRLRAANGHGVPEQSTTLATRASATMARGHSLPMLTDGDLLTSLSKERPCPPRRPFLPGRPATGRHISKRRAADCGSQAAHTTESKAQLPRATCRGLDTPARRGSTCGAACCGCSAVTVWTPMGARATSVTRGHTQSINHRVTPRGA